MTFALDTHEEGCTPLKPCKNCRALSFLRQHLKGKAFTSFLEIIGAEGTVAENLGATITDETPIQNIDSDQLDNRVRSCLFNENIITIGDLLGRTESELLRIPNFGHESMRRLRAFLDEHNLTLKGRA